VPLRPPPLPGEPLGLPLQAGEQDPEEPGHRFWAPGQGGADHGGLALGLDPPIAPRAAEPPLLPPQGRPAGLTPGPGHRLDTLPELKS